MSNPSGSRPQKAWVLRHRVITAIGAVLLLGLIADVAGGGPEPVPVSTVAIDPAATSAASQEGVSAAGQAAADLAAGQAALDKVAADTAAAKKAAVARAATAQAAAARHPASGTALAAVAKLPVKGRAPKTGYSRDQFGQAWFDTDRNGCDTRNDILRRDLKSRQMKNACKVMAGTLAPDPYTASSIRFVYGGASEVDIDHVVALSDAWQ